MPSSSVSTASASARQLRVGDRVPAIAASARSVAMTIALEPPSPTSRGIVERVADRARCRRTARRARAVAAKRATVAATSGWPPSGHCPSSRGAMSSVGGRRRRRRRGEVAQRDGQRRAAVAVGRVAHEAGARASARRASHRPAARGRARACARRSRGRSARSQERGGVALVRADVVALDVAEAHRDDGRAAGDEQRDRVGQLELAADAPARSRAARRRWRAP